MKSFYSILMCFALLFLFLVPLSVTGLETNSNYKPLNTSAHQSAVGINCRDVVILQSTDIIYAIVNHNLEPKFIIEYHWSNGRPENIWKKLTQLREGVYRTDRTVC